jgi:hypothetical protein
MDNDPTICDVVRVLHDVKQRAATEGTEYVHEVPQSGQSMIELWEQPERERFLGSVKLCGGALHVLTCNRALFPHNVNRRNATDEPSQPENYHSHPRKSSTVGSHGVY